MARVLVPVQARTYNHNPRGSSTAVVTMKASNPFETLAGSSLRRVPTSSMPGMGAYSCSGMGDDPAPASTGIDWTKIATSAATAIAPLAAAEAQKLLTKPAAAATVQSIQPLIIQQQPAYAAPKAASKLPWIIGGAAVLGLGLFLIMRKRK